MIECCYTETLKCRKADEISAFQLFSLSAFQMLDYFQVQEVNW